MGIYIDFGVVGFIIVTIFIIKAWRETREDREAAKDLERYKRETERESEKSVADETEDTTDPIDKEGYEWWNDPRWRE